MFQKSFQELLGSARKVDTKVTNFLAKVDKKLSPQTIVVKQVLDCLKITFKI
jgi:hypothetical protein